MDNIEIKNQLQLLANKLDTYKYKLTNEEITKTSIIMPFLKNVLGYDVFDPQEVMAEYTADVGNKKGEKVDYAININKKPAILVECKKFNEELQVKHTSQLFRYFNTCEAKIALLTNGLQYQFFTDIETPNIMDSTPYLTLDLSNLQDYYLKDLVKLSKDKFNINDIMYAANNLKYLGLIKNTLAKEFSQPTDEFIKFIGNKVYNGVLTSKRKEIFAPLCKQAIGQFLNDMVNKRIKTALDNNREDEEQHITVENKTLINTTDEEVEGFHIVQSIVRNIINPKTITMRDAINYCTILYENNSRKPIVKLYFNTKNKYITIFNNTKEANKYPIANLNEIYNFSEDIIATAKTYIT